MTRSKLMKFGVVAGVFLLSASTIRAQVLGMGSILRLASGSTIDHWYFSVNSAGTITFDTKSWERDPNNLSVFIDVNGDGEIAFFNTKVMLFADDGALDAADLIASNDNSSLTFGDGSISKNDAYLSRSLTIGTYILAIGATGMSVADAIAGIHPSSYYPRGMNFAQSDHGDYQILFTGDLTVTSMPANAHLSPEPAPHVLLLFGVGALLLMGWSRRLRSI